MPKNGYKSITIKDSIYDNFEKIYKKNKQKLLSERGITSFAGYMTWILAKLMKKDPITSEHIPRFSVITMKDILEIIIKDNERDHIIRLTHRDAGDDYTLFCNYCDHFECIHVGFLYGSPQYYERMTMAKKEKDNSEVKK